MLRWVQNLLHCNVPDPLSEGVACETITAMHCRIKAILLDSAMHCMINSLQRMRVWKCYNNSPFNIGPLATPPALDLRLYFREAEAHRCVTFLNLITQVHKKMSCCYYSASRHQVFIIHLLPTSVTFNHLPHIANHLSLLTWTWSSGQLHILHVRSPPSPPPSPIPVANTIHVQCFQPSRSVFLYRELGWK
jgi:hypothetical protein